MALVTLADVQAARALLDGVVRTTPLEGCRPLAALVGGPVSLKCENLQRTGSFKLRGAYVRHRAAHRRRAGPRRRRGQRRQPRAGRRAGRRPARRPRAPSSCREAAPLPKVAATRGYGAEVRLAGADASTRRCVAAQRVRRRAPAPCSSTRSTTPDVVAGQGTVGLEVLEQCPDVRTVVVCTGGGGLVAGIAVGGQGAAARRAGGGRAGRAGRRPSRARSTPGGPTALASMATMADGIAVGRPGDAHLRARARPRRPGGDGRARTPLSRALLLCLERAKLVVEPAGAAAVAAVLDDPRGFEPPVVAVVSRRQRRPAAAAQGDPARPAGRRPLPVAARARSRTARASSPGCSAVLAETGANVLDVEHQRTGRGLHLDEVEVCGAARDAGAEAQRREVTRCAARAGYAAVPG